MSAVVTEFLNSGPECLFETFHLGSNDLSKTNDQRRVDTALSSRGHYPM